MGKYDFPILITSSVTPVHQVQINNCSERLMQYKLSIYRWAMETKFNKIVLVDNTNTRIFSDDEINKFKDINVEIEQILSEPNPIISQRGTSYGISEIYKIAINESKFINESTHFAKVTGRLFVENMSDLITTISPDDSYLIRWLSKGFFRFKPGRFDERFAIYNKKFYIDNLLPLMSELDDSKGRWIEIVYNQLLENKCKSIKSFNVYPRIVGISGHSRQPYDGSSFLKWKIKDLISSATGALKY